jgi:hypothetical protein
VIVVAVSIIAAIMLYNFVGAILQQQANNARFDKQFDQYLNSTLQKQEDCIALHGGRDKISDQDQLKCFAASG